MRWIVRIERIVALIARLCGGLAALAMVLMLLNVFYDVIMRYAFSQVSIAAQEMEWHLFAVSFMLAIPYAIHTNSHVRIDILSERWTDRRKAWINLFGTVLFLWPPCVLIIFFGTDFAFGAFTMGEGSGDPGGLPQRWIIKSVIPLTFVLVAIVSLSYITQALRVLCFGERYPEHNSEDHLA